MSITSLSPDKMTDMSTRSIDVDSLPLIMMSDFASFIDDAETCDVRFVIGKDGARFNAHRLLLWARCPAFRKYRHQFWNNGISQRPLTFIYAHYDIVAFRKVMEFIYTGQIVLKLTFVVDVLLISSEFQLAALVAACQKFIVGFLKTDNACYMWRHLWLMQENNPDISEKAVGGPLQACRDVVVERTAECALADEWLQLPKPLMMAIVTGEGFARKMERLWPAILSWAKYQAGIRLDDEASTLNKYEKELVLTALAGVMIPMDMDLLNSYDYPENSDLRHSPTSWNCIEREPTKVMPLQLDIHSTPLSDWFNGSALLIGESSLFQDTLNFWYGEVTQKWRRIYRGSEDGFSASRFHCLCDGQGSSFVLVQSTTGRLFGGYSDVDWSSEAPSTGHYDASNSSFLFELFHPSSRCHPRKFEVQKPHFAILQHYDFGPIFGAGADLSIASDCDVNDDSYMSPHSYDSGAADGDCEYFRVRDYEVFVPMLSNA